MVRDTRMVRAMPTSPHPRRAREGTARVSDPACAVTYPFPCRQPVAIAWRGRQYCAVHADIPRSRRRRDAEREVIEAALALADANETCQALFGRLLTAARALREPPA